MSDPDRDAYYCEILEGLARHAGDPFLLDVARAVRRHPVPGLSNALNKNQLASKRWLLDALHGAAGGRLAAVRVLGGWYGVLAAMLLADPRFEVETVISIDLDPACGEVAGSLNRRHLQGGRFRALTADMLALEYPPPRRGGPPDVLINTSCEHLRDFGAWYRRIPAGTLQVLQSNDQFDCAEHESCVADLETFRRLAPMAELLFAGALPLRRYTRFMLIGRR